MKIIKQFKFSLLIVLLNFSLLLGHSERVHQYIVIESYELMKLHIGCDVPEMLEYLGSTETNGYTSWYNRGDEFTSGKIAAGAYREDVTDIVYGYGESFTQEFFASLTHFWDADEDDEYPSNFYNFYSPTIPYSDIPNAYQKIRKYANGNWNVPGGGLDKYMYKYNGRNVCLYNLQGSTITYFWFFIKVSG